MHFKVSFGVQNLRWEAELWGVEYNNGLTQDYSLIQIDLGHFKKIAFGDVEKSKKADVTKMFHIDIYQY